MIPETRIETGFHLPRSVRPPRADEISEEGFGLFRGVWHIPPGWQRADALELLVWERRTIETLGLHARSPADFDRLAEALENYAYVDESSLEDEYADLDSAERKAIQSCGGDPAAGLDGLELGVAGLVAALSAGGYYPAASCRGHSRVGAWSECPTVFFAGEYSRVALLSDLVLRNGAQLSDGSGNGAGLVVIHAPSVMACSSIAEGIMELQLVADEAE